MHCSFKRFPKLVHCVNSPPNGLNFSLGSFTLEVVGVIADIEGVVAAAAGGATILPNAFSILFRLLLLYHYHFLHQNQAFQGTARCLYKFSRWTRESCSSVIDTSYYSERYVCRLVILVDRKCMSLVLHSKVNPVWGLFPCPGNR